MTGYVVAVASDKYIEAKTIHNVKLLGFLRVSEGGILCLGDRRMGVGRGGTWTGHGDRIVYK
jgi:hypothetical protein